MRLCCVVIAGVLIAGYAVGAGAETPEQLQAVRERVEAYRLVREGFSELQAANLAMVEDAPPYGIDPPNETHRAMLTRAIDLASQALVLVVDLPDAHLVIANAYWALDQLDLTEHHYTMLLELDPARDDVLSARVGLRIELEDWDGARDDVQRLAEIESEYAESAAEELDLAGKD